MHIQVYDFHCPYHQTQLKTQSIPALIQNKLPVIRWPLLLLLTYGGHSDHHEIHAVPVAEAVDPVYLIRVEEVRRVAAIL